MRDERPWQSVEGIEFRALTVRAFKGKEGPCLERHQGVIYKGPWRSVTDDDGHTLFRGQRMAVCDKTFNIYKSDRRCCMNAGNSLIPLILRFCPKNVTC